MAGTQIGSAEFLLLVNQQGLVTGMQQGEAAARDGSARIQQAIDGNLKKAEQSASRFGESFKKSLEIGAGIAGVQLGVEGLRAGLEKIVSVTKEAERAQLGLTKTYGAGAAQFNEFSKQMAAATGQSALQFQKAGAEARSLANNYGLTNKQIQELIKRSADLATVSGVTTADAFHRVEAALRGEAESAEVLGLSLNANAVQAFANLTDEQKKNFNTLDQVTKAQIIYNELMRQSASDEGAAAQGAGGLSQALVKAEAAATAVAGMIGTELTPAFAGFGEALGPIPEAIHGVIDAMHALNDIKVPDWMLGKGIVQGPSLFERITGRKFGEAPPGEVLIGPGGRWIDTSPSATAEASQGTRFGPSTSEVAAAQETQRIEAAQALARREADKRRAKEILDQRKEDVEAAAEIQIKGLERQKVAAERSYQAQVAAAHKAKDAELKAAEDKHAGAIRGIEQEAQAAADGYERQIRAAEVARDKEKQASEDRRDDAVKSLDEVQQAARDANDAQIRDQEIARDRRKQAAEDVRDAAVRGLDVEKRARDNARIQEDRAREDQTTEIKRAEDDRHDAIVRSLEDESKRRQAGHEQQLRRLEDEARKAQANHDKRVSQIEAEQQRAQDGHEATLRRLEDEANAAEHAHDLISRAIQEQSDAERERHRLAVQDIEDEAERRIGAIDKQIKALDDAQKSEDRAARAASLREKATDAQKQLTDLEAQNTRAQAALTEASRQLAAVRATRVAAPGVLVRAQNAVSAASAGLVPLDQLTKARQDAAAAEAELAKDGVETTREAEKDKLAAAKDAIKDEADARKRAEDDKSRTVDRELDTRKQAADDELDLIKGRVAAERQAADDELASTKRRLDAEKDAADQGLKKQQDSIAKQKLSIDDATRSEIESIGKRKQAEADRHDAAVTAARDQTEQQKREIEDRRRAEDQADQDKRREITDTYELEQRQIRATYDDEETGAIPALRRAREAAEREFGQKRQVIEAAYKAEQDAIKATYDGPEGAIQRIRDQAEAAARDYGERKRVVNEAYQAEKDRIGEVYDDPEHGLFANLEAAKTKTIDSLNDQVEKWRTWKTDTVKEIQDALDKLDEFLKKVGALDHIGTIDVNGSPVNTNPGGRSGGPGGDGPGARTGAGAGDVPEPYQVQFPFGARYSNPFNQGIPIHRGVDLTVKGAPNGGKGYPVQAFEDGEVVYQAFDPNGGNGVIIRGDDGLYHRYFHFDSTKVGVGDTVHRGDVIGVLGETGTEGSPHLHYEVSKDSGGDPIGSLIDPVPYMHAQGGGADEEIELTLFGRKIKIQAGSANIPGEVGRAIADALSITGAPRSWAKSLAQIIGAESGQRNSDGSVVIGSGANIPGGVDPQDGQQPYGYPQIKPQTFVGYAVPPYTDITNPVHQVAAMIRYIQANPRYGSPLNTPYFENGVFDWRGVDGYADGGVIREPTLLYGLRTGARGVMAERGDERILSADQTRAYGSDSTVVNVSGIGLDEVAGEIVRRLHRARLLASPRP